MYKFVIEYKEVYERRLVADFNPKKLISNTLRKNFTLYDDNTGQQRKKKTN